MRRSAFLLISLFLTSSAFAATPRIKSGYFKTSDGVRLHYLEGGSGPGMIFIPGWSMPAWIWDAQIHKQKITSGGWSPRRCGCRPTAPSPPASVPSAEPTGAPPLQNSIGLC